MADQNCSRFGTSCFSSNEGGKHDVSPEARSAPSPGNRESAGVRGLLPTAQDPAPFPWREAMAIGFGVLRLSSREFWALTPRELAAAIEDLTGRTHAPMDSTRLDDLMRRFPDH